MQLVGAYKSHNTLSVRAHNMKVVTCESS